MIDQKKWRPIAIDELEPAAWEVVRSRANKVVIAGPGSGKTELLAQRACFLLQTGIVRSPRRILALSFKRDAAKNLKDRVSQRCDTADAARLDSLTFDGFAKSLLDRFYPALAEQWRPSSDYDIISPTDRDYSDFLNALDHPPPQIATPADLQAVPRLTFQKKAILGDPLPENGIVATNASTWAASKWWEDCLRGRTQSQLTFPMIGRLVEFVIRTNPKIRQAIRATYSDVFLDEFQDTTHVQYGLVKTIFLGSNRVLTAVGDNKQQIMRWAMALDDPFSMFEADFGAKRIHLVRNYRSSPELVRIQHKIALEVDTKSEPAESRVTGDFQQGACVVLEFSTAEDEGKYLAKLIGTAISKGELAPRDFAVLVRQRASQYVNQLKPLFQQSGVRLRDESRLQDILAERLTEVLLLFLRCGSLKRAGHYWTDCARIVVSLWGSDTENDHEGHLLHHELGKFQSILRDQMVELPASPERLREIIDAVVDFLGEDNIKLTYSEYQQGDWYRQVLDNIVNNLFQSCQAYTDWPSALDDFEGLTSVPLMTIHKSKGLEYHTVIFLALDDQAWWTFQQEPEEGRSTFFVAFSRAKQRVVFTYCMQPGGRSKVESLYEILRSAGVPTYGVQ